MKWKSLKPYIEQFAIATLLYIVLPIILFSTKLVSITVNKTYGNVGIVLLMALGCLYFYYILAFLIPGVYSIADLMTNNFITEKMVFINSYVDSSRIFVSNKATAKRGKLSILNEYCFMKILFANQERKAVFSSVFFHTMEKNKWYIIQYGRFSKVVVSILSEQGEELLKDR